MFNGTIWIDKRFLLRNVQWLGFRVSIHNAKAIRDMALYAISWYKRLAELIDFKMNGLLKVYTSHKVLEHRFEYIIDICNDLNIRYEVLNKEQVKALEHRLKGVEYAIYYPEDTMLNPAMLMNNLKCLLASMNVKFFNSIKHIEYDYSSKIKDSLD